MKRYGITYAKGKILDDKPKEVIKGYDKSIDQKLLQVFSDEKGNVPNSIDINDLANLIEGNERIGDKGEKSILLMGNTGAGKSTYMHALAGKELQVILNPQTSIPFIDAMQPLGNIVIGNAMAAETKMPNKHKIQDTLLWDCPGFKDTSIVQEVANSFYIKKLLENSNKLKVLLVVTESNILDNRGIIFLETIEQLMKTFNNKNDLSECISLVITKSDRDMQDVFIKKVISNILEQNQQVTPEIKGFVEKVVDNQIYLFTKAPFVSSVAPYKYEQNLFDKTDGSGKYIDCSPDMASVSVSSKAKEYSAKLLEATKYNFDQILSLIVKAVLDPTNCMKNNHDNILIQNHDFISQWLPKQVDYNNFSLNQIQVSGHFLELEQIQEIKNLLEGMVVDSVDKGVESFQRVLSVFENFAVGDGYIELRKVFQNYSKVLQQQYDYIKFLSEVCEEKLPDSSSIAKIIEECKLKISDNFEYQIKSLMLDTDSDDPTYYDKAVQYMEFYPDSDACKKVKSEAFCRLGELAQKGANGAPDYALALHYYAYAIKSDKQLPEIYKKMGKLFANQHNYEKAISCFKVIKRSDKVKECFKEILKTKKGDEKVDVLIKKGDYFVSIGNKEKAISCYTDAAGKAKNSDKRDEARSKHIEMIKGSPEITKYFDELVNDHRAYDFDMVNDEFVTELMG